MKRSTESFDASVADAYSLPKSLLRFWPMSARWFAKARLYAGKCGLTATGRRGALHCRLHRPQLRDCRNPQGVVRTQPHRFTSRCCRWHAHRASIALSELMSGRRSSDPCSRFDVGISFWSSAGSPTGRCDRSNRRLLHRESLRSDSSKILWDLGRRSRLGGGDCGYLLAL